jgi:hypothetical protein
MRCQEVLKNTNLVAAVNRMAENLSASQKKLVAHLLDQKAENDSPKSSAVEAPKNAVMLNTSAFSRRQRHRALSTDDGVRLLCDLSSFTSFYRRLSHDVHDVFEDRLAILMLSPHSQQRLQAIENLRDVFQASSANFEHSADIIIRWCCVQFVGRHIHMAQEALLLLIDQFSVVSDTLILARVEVHIIVPVLLWFTAIQSDAFSGLLHDVKRFSHEIDFGAALLAALRLEHIVVLTTVFEELKGLSDFSGIQDELKRLADSPNPLISYECKRALVRSAAQPSKELKQDPVDLLRRAISRIRSFPDAIEDLGDIFGFILSEFESAPTNHREIRYLLHLAIVFLGEPSLSCLLTDRNVVALAHALCDFSLSCPPSFGDAMREVAFCLVCVRTSLLLFQTLLNFVGEHKQNLNRRAFPCQFFILAVSMFAISAKGSDLDDVRVFTKGISGNEALPSDDLPKVLCSTLVKEVMTLQQERETEGTCEKVVDTKPAEPEEEQSLDGSEVVRILEALGSSTTKGEGIKMLTELNQRFPRQKLIETILRLAPSLRREFDEPRKRQPPSKNQDRSGSPSSSPSKTSTRENLALQRTLQKDMCPRVTRTAK